MFKSYIFDNANKNGKKNLASFVKDKKDEIEIKY